MKEGVTEGRTTLVTGGTGFIGQRLVRTLCGEGRRVRVLTRRSRLPESFGGLGVEVVQGDLRHGPTIRHCLEDVDVVYALGAETRPDAERRLFYEVNLDSVATLMTELRRRRKVRRVVHVSCAVTAGAAERNSLADERCHFNLWKTRSDYAISKYLGELEVRRAAASGRVPAVIVNPTIAVGPAAAQQLQAAPVLPFAGSTGIDAIRVNLVDVRDVVAGLLQAETKGEVGERYLLGGENVAGSELSLFTLQNGRGGRARPSRRSRRSVSWAGIDLRRHELIYASRKAASVLGWTPRSFANSLDGLSAAS